MFKKGKFMNKFKPNFLELVPDLNQETKPTIVHKKSNASIEDFKTLMIIKELEGLVAKQVAIIRDQKEKQKLMMPKPEVPRYEANILVGDKVNKVAENQGTAKENKLEVNSVKETKVKKTKTEESRLKENSQTNTKNPQETATKKANRKRQGERVKNEAPSLKTKGGNLQKNRIKVYKSRSGKTQQGTSSSTSGHGKRARTRRIRTRPKNS